MATIYTADLYKDGGLEATIIAELEGDDWRVFINDGAIGQANYFSRWQADPVASLNRALEAMAGRHNWRIDLESLLVINED